MALKNSSETLVQGGNDDANLAAMVRNGHSMVREGRAMIRAAENMGAAPVPSLSAGEETYSVDFNTLLGRSAEARAEALYIGRRMRDRLFPDSIFGEPAWDLLLILFLAEREGNDADIDATFIECRIPRATGIRYVEQLVELGLVDDNSEAGGTTKIVVLTAAGTRSMTRLFELTEGTTNLQKGSVGPRLSATSGGPRDRSAHKRPSPVD